MKEATFINSIKQVVRAYYAQRIQVRSLYSGLTIYKYLWSQGQSLHYCLERYSRHTCFFICCVYYLWSAICTFHALIVSSRFSFRNMRYWNAVFFSVYDLSFFMGNSAFLSYSCFNSFSTAQLLLCHI